MVGGASSERSSPSRPGLRTGASSQSSRRQASISSVRTERDEAGSRLFAFNLDGTLWVVEADGSGDPRQLPTTDENNVASEGGHPAWSPDSRRVVFEVRHDRGRYLRKAMSRSHVGIAADAVERITYGGFTGDDPAWRDGILGKSGF